MLGSNVKRRRYTPVAICDETEQLRTACHEMERNVTKLPESLASEYPEYLRIQRVCLRTLEKPLAKQEKPLAKLGKR